LSGKTTNLEKVHEFAPKESKGDLTSISTDGDRTLFFDFMPLDLGSVAGMRTKFHIYTVPGQVYYNSTRKLVLLGADGIIFVADSSPGTMEGNKESLNNLKENLLEMGKDIAKMPLVLQWNKRDMPDAMPVELMEKELNLHKRPSYEAVANKGDGVIQTLKGISALVLESINSNERSSATVVVPPSAVEKPARAASLPRPRRHGRPRQWRLRRIGPGRPTWWDARSSGTTCRCRASWKRRERALPRPHRGVAAPLFARSRRTMTWPWRRC